MGMLAVCQGATLSSMTNRISKYPLIVDISRAVHQVLKMLDKEF